MKSKFHAIAVARWPQLKKWQLGVWMTGRLNIGATSVLGNIMLTKMIDKMMEN